MFQGREHGFRPFIIEECGLSNGFTTERTHLPRAQVPGRTRRKPFENLSELRDLGGEKTFSPILYATPIINL